MRKIGPYEINSIVTGDATILAESLPDNCVDLIFAPLHFVYLSSNYVATYNHKLLHVYANNFDLFFMDYYNAFSVATIAGYLIKVLKKVKNMVLK